MAIAVAIGCGGAEMSADAAVIHEDAFGFDSATPVDSGAPDAPIVGEDAGSVADADTDGGSDGGTVADAGPPDGGPERCATEGTFRAVPCECMGTRPERCTGGVWTDAGACSGDGECEAGAVMVEDRPEVCSIRQRTCGEDCSWGAWEVIRPPGECDIFTRICDFDRECWCNEMCMCEPCP